MDGWMDGWVGGWVGGWMGLFFKRGVFLSQAHFGPTCAVACQKKSTSITSSMSSSKGLPGFGGLISRASLAALSAGLVEALSVAEVK